MTNGREVHMLGTDRDAAPHSLLARLVGEPLEVQLLKDKPGRRRTMRVAGPTRSLIVKVFESGRAPIVAARLNALAAGPDEPRVPELVLLDAGQGLIAISELPGRSLGTILRETLPSDIPSARAAGRRTGRALAEWHHFWRGRNPAPLVPHTLRREVEILAERAAAAPTAIAQRVNAAVEEPGPEWLCSTVVHRDLYEEQILLNDRVGLVDLDSVALGAPELDLGNLVAHLELFELRTGATVKPVVVDLLAAYSSTGPLDVNLLERCRRMALLRLACIHRLPWLLERAGA